MTGSNFVLSVLMDHAGVIRRSEDEFSDTTCKGTSAMIAKGSDQLVRSSEMGELFLVQFAQVRVDRLCVKVCESWRMALGTICLLVH